MAEDFGQKFGLNLESDSSAAKSVATRRVWGRFVTFTHTTVMATTTIDESRVVNLEGERKRQ